MTVKRTVARPILYNHVTRHDVGRQSLLYVDSFHPISASSIHLADSTSNSCMSDTYAHGSLTVAAYIEKK